MKVEPWDQQPDESNKAFKAFKLYLDMGYKRTVKRVAISLGAKSYTYIYEWSAKFKWRDRVKNWEKEQSRLQLAASYENYKSICEEHLLQAKNLRHLMKIPTQALALKLKEPDAKKEIKSKAIEELDNLHTKDLIELVMRSARTLELLVKVERLAIGAPTEITQSELDLDFNDNDFITYGEAISANEESVKKITEILDELGNVKNCKSGKHGTRSDKRKLLNS
jgi:hypothetical protein